MYASCSGRGSPYPVKELEQARATLVGCLQVTSSRLARVLARSDVERGNCVNSQNQSYSFATFETQPTINACPPLLDIEGGLGKVDYRRSPQQHCGVYRCDYCPLLDRLDTSMLAHLSATGHASASLYNALTTADHLGPSADQHHTGVQSGSETGYHLMSVSKMLALVNPHEMSTAFVVCPRCRDIFADIFQCGLHDKHEHGAVHGSYTICPVRRLAPVVLSSRGRCLSCGAEFSSHRLMHEHWKVEPLHSPISDHFDVSLAGDSNGVVSMSVDPSFMGSKAIAFSSVGLEIVSLNSVGSKIVALSSMGLKTVAPSSKYSEAVALSSVGTETVALSSRSSKTVALGSTGSNTEGFCNIDSMPVRTSFMTSKTIDTACLCSKTVGSISVNSMRVGTGSKVSKFTTDSKNAINDPARQSSATSDHNLTSDPGLSSDLGSTLATPDKINLLKFVYECTFCGKRFHGKFYQCKAHILSTHRYELGFQSTFTIQATQVLQAQFIGELVPFSADISGRAGTQTEGGEAQIVLGGRGTGLDSEIAVMRATKKHFNQFGMSRSKVKQIRSRLRVMQMHSQAVTSRE